MSVESPASAGAMGQEHEVSPIEKRLIALVMAGYTPRQCARLMGESEHSVRQRLRTIIARLGVSNRLELVLFALHHNLIASDEISVQDASNASLRRRTKPAA